MDDTLLPLGQKLEALICPHIRVGFSVQRHAMCDNIGLGINSREITRTKMQAQR